jgi:hypothetical protein
VFVYSTATREAALKLMRAGCNDCEIGRRLGVPRTTVRDWRHPRYERIAVFVDTCARCWRPMTDVEFTADDYSELLGLYLGDGHISELPRTQRLRLSLDSRYPGIVAETRELLRRCFPANRAGTVFADRGATTVLGVYHQHLSCLFPQHGPGKKHERRIALEPWQRAFVDAAPWAFLRGCIRSDGCVFVNRTGPYEYVSYDFCNVSRDIRELFADVCRLRGVECRVYERRVRVYRRASVGLLLENVGVKA